MKKMNKFMLVALMSIVSIGTANAQCTASFTGNDLGNGDFAFSGTVTPASNNASFFWDLGDGNTGTQQNYTHTYNSGGTYYVCLTVTDSSAMGGSGCTTTFCDSILVSGGTTPPCNASFTYNGNGNGSVSFAGTPAGNYYYHWDLGDGNYGSNQNYTHTYANAGTYVVCLTINDTVFGGTCTSTFCDTVVASGGGNPPCNIVAGISMVDNGQGNYTFTSTSTGNVSDNVWGFGDGTSDVGSSVSHTFAANGTYVISLLSTDSNAFFGCYDYATMTIVVTGVINPVSCQAGFVMFLDSATNGVIVVNSSTGNNLSYLWDFGDGNTSTLPYPSYTYNSNGPFNLCLTVDDGNNCVSTYCDSIGSNGIVLKGASGFSFNTTNPEGTVGVAEMDNVANLEVYPNPVSNNVNIEFNLTEQTNVTVSITDLLGKTIASVVSEEMNAGNNQINYATSAIPNGVYLLKINTENTLQVRKMVVNK